MINPFEDINSRLANIEKILLGMSAPMADSQPQLDQEQVLTVKEAAAFLHLSVPTIYGLISQEKIPCMKRTKRVYFSKTELIDYLKKGRKKTNADARTETDTYLSDYGKTKRRKA